MVIRRRGRSPRPIIRLELFIEGTPADVTLISATVSDALERLESGEGRLRESSLMTHEISGRLWRRGAESIALGSPGWSPWTMEHPVDVADTAGGFIDS